LHSREGVFRAVSLSQHASPVVIERSFPDAWR
jgi:hypothetical protein